MRLGDAWKNSDIVNRITDKPSSPHSSIFRASNAWVSIETNLIAEQEDDASFIFIKLLDEIKQEVGSIHQETRNPPHKFCTITGDLCLACASSVKLDVFVQILHETRLVLRTIQWKVTEKNITPPIIGQKVFEFL